jgi:hypothetical protein
MIRPPYNIARRFGQRLFGFRTISTQTSGGPLIDLKGRTFGQLTVIERRETDRLRHRRWLCECDCGQTTIVRQDLLRSGRSQTCGSCRVELTGQQFGCWRVLSRVTSGRRAAWMCQCACGAIKTVLQASLCSGRSRSCGCARQSPEVRARISATLKGRVITPAWREKLSASLKGRRFAHSFQRGNRPASYKHGMCGTPLYHCWDNMKRRCLNPRDSRFKNYGGRGLGIAGRWMDFQAFFTDIVRSIGQRPPGASAHF